MKVLLDTHTLLWAMLAPDSLSQRAAEVVADEANTVFVSAASAWEIATQVRLGKLSGAEDLEHDLAELLDEAGYTALPITIADGLRAGRFAADHRDPFDRMLAAQALALGIPVVSIDAKLEVFGVERLW